MQGKRYRSAADHYSSQHKFSNASRQTADTDTGQLLLLSFPLNSSKAQRLILWKQRFLEIKWQDAIFHPAGLLHGRWRQTAQLTGCACACANAHVGFHSDFQEGVKYAFRTTYTVGIFNASLDCNVVLYVYIWCEKWLKSSVDESYFLFFLNQPITHYCLLRAWWTSLNLFMTQASGSGLYLQKPLKNTVQAFYKYQTLW